VTGLAAPGAQPGAFRIDREGSWRHEGHEVTHPGVLENLYANLRVDAEGHYLEVGPRRIPVAVDDTPFVVTRIELVTAEAPGPARVRAQLSDGTMEPLDLDSLLLDPRGVPYCRVKEGRFGARLAVAAWLQLAALLTEEGGRPVLVLGSRRVPLVEAP
jgi:hypothetical protein